MQPNEREPISALDIRNFSAGLLLLMMEVASIILGQTSFALGDQLGETLRTNQFPPDARERLLIALAVAVPLTAAAATYVARRTGAAQLLHGARIASPLIPLGLLPALLCSKYWFTAPLDYLVMLAFVGLLCEVSCRPFFEFVGPLTRKHIPERIWSLLHKPWIPLAVVGFAATAYTIVTAYLTILDHHRFGTGSYDLGIFDNMMFNTLHGRLFRSSIMYGPSGGNSIAGHAEFGMVIFAPLYALWPKAEGLLTMQALALGGAAIPLYLLARTRLEGWSSCLIALLYLLYAPVHGAQYYDFHWLTMATPFLFLEFYGLAIGSKKIVIPTTLLLFALREDVPPGLAIVGLFLLVTGTRPKWGAALAVSSAVWFGVLKFVIMPHFGTWFFADLYKELAVPGEPGYGSVMKTLVSNPLFVVRHMFTTEKLSYMLHILAPLAFLPLRRPIYWLLLVPGAFFTILTNWPAAYSLKYHYSTHFTPYVFGASILYLSLFRSTESDDAATKTKRFGRYGAALASVTFVLLCHSTVFGLILDPDSFIGGIQPVSYTMTKNEKERLSNLEKVIDLIPPHASVTATDWDVPHLSNRKEIYAIGQSRFAGQYLLLGPESFRLAKTKENIGTLLDEYPYGFVAKVGKFTLWKKGHTPKDPAEAKKARATLLRQIGKHRPRSRRH